MVLTFCIVLFIMMMNFVWRYIDELVGKGLDFGVIVELLFYAMANTMPMGLPLATLLAAIMTMGNLGENYELLAMKSAGMSLPRILRPLIIVVAFVAVGTFKEIKSSVFRNFFAGFLRKFSLYIMDRSFFNMPQYYNIKKRVKQVYRNFYVYIMIYK